MKLSVSHRGKTTPVTEAKEVIIESLEDLNKLPKGDIIFWETSDLSCLDIDYHGTTPPANAADLIKYVYPSPCGYDVSKRGGLHLYYQSVGGYTGKELASIAYFSAQKVYTACSGIEVIQKTCRASKVHSTPLLAPEKSKLFDTFGRKLDAGDKKALLESFGVQPGESRRVATRLCPFTNHNVPESEDTNPSVHVYPDRVKCFRCNKSASLYALAEGKVDTDLQRYTQNLVWWDLMELYLFNFVRHDLRPMHLESTSKGAYSGLLKALHSGDYRRAWALERLHLYRSHDGLWVSPSGIPYKDSEAKNLVKLIPILNTGGYKETKEGYVPFARGKSLKSVLVELFNNSGEDLRKYLPPCTISQGVNLAYANVDETYDLRKYHTDKEKFVYKRVKGVDVLEAFNTLSKHINIYRKNDNRYKPIPAKNVIMLLMAQLFSEYKGEKPILVATGVSGSGKTLLPRLASAMLRTRCVVCPSGMKKEHRKEAFGAAVYSGARLFVHDEALKDSTPSEYLDLNSGETFSRVLYLGFKRLRSDCCSVITGITLPQEFYEHGQFMRRAVVLPRLTSRKEWNAAGVMQNFISNRDIKDAVDVILSYVKTLLPSTDKVGTFKDFWAKTETLLLPELNECGEGADDNPDELENPINTRFSNIDELLQCVKEHGTASTASKWRKALMFPKSPTSEPWKMLQSLFMGVDLTGKMPTEVLDYFSEYDLTDMYGVENMSLELLVSRDNVALRIRKGRKILDYNEFMEGKNYEARTATKGATTSSK